MNIFKLPVTGLFRKKERAGDLEFLFEPGLKSRSESEKTPENPERKHSRTPEKTSENIPEKYNQVKFEAQNPSGSPGNAAMPVFQPDCTANRLAGKSTNAHLTASGKTFINRFIWQEEPPAPTPQEAEQQ